MAVVAKTYGHKYLEAVLIQHLHSLAIILNTSF